MSILVIPCGPLETNSYIVYDPSTLSAVIIDTPPDSFESIKQVVKQRNLKPEKLLLTHSHWDHTTDAKAVSEEYKIPIYIHPRDLGNLETPGSDGLPCWFEIPAAKADHLLKEGDQIQVGNLTFQVIETPGHTPGGVCFYDPKHNILIAGDTLFRGSIGNLSFPTARPNEMWESLKKLSKLPSNTVVYPGHGPSTTIGAEPWLSNANDVFS